jgi:hypothetical protein
MVRVFTVHALYVKMMGEPPTGNPYKRFDEGEGLPPVPTLLANKKTSVAHRGMMISIIVTSSKTNARMSMKINSNLPTQKGIFVSIKYSATR